MHKYTISALIIIVLIYTGVTASSGEEKVLLIDTNASCITASCHDGIGKKKYVHAAGVDPALCKSCHEVVRQGEHSFNKIPPETAYLCAPCHSSTSTIQTEADVSPPKVMGLDGNTQSHMPFAEGKCTACHDAHESDFQYHLKAEYPESTYQYYSSTAYALCFNAGCHPGLEDTFAAPRTLELTGFRNGNRNLHYIHVNQVKGRSCKVCHHHHTAEKPVLMNDSFQFGNRQLSIDFEKTAGGGSCKATCHREARYDRYEPVYNTLQSSSLPGREATAEELKASLERDLEKQEEGPDADKSGEIPDSEDEKKQ